MRKSMQSVKSDFRFCSRLNRSIVAMGSILLGLCLSCDKKNQPVEKKQEGYLIPEKFDDLLIGKINGKDFKVSDLSDSNKKYLWLSFSQFRKVMEASAQDQAEIVYFTEMAGGDRKKAEELMAKEKTVKTITDGDAKAYYESHKKNIPYPFDSIKDELVKHLTAEEKAKVETEVTTKIKEKIGLELFLPKVLPASFEINTIGYPTKGAADAPIEIIEFADFRCPHCSAANPNMKKLLEKYSGKVKLVYRYYIRRGVPFSSETAVAAECAHRQGRFWEYHDLLFQNQAQDLPTDKLMDLVKNVGIDTKTWKQCALDQKTLDYVSQSQKEGAQIGVLGTPTFYVDGQVVSTDHDLKDLEAEITKLMK